MNYHPKSKSIFSRYKTLIFAFLAFIFLLGFVFLFPIFNRSFWTTSAKPFWSVGSSVSGIFSGTVDFFKFKSSLIAENTDLKNQIQALELKTVDYDSLTKENEELKNILVRKENQGRVLARVISHPPQSPYDTMILDAGATDGILVGNKVYLSAGVIIGTIASVTNHSSVVEMFSTGDKKNEAVQERTGSGFEVIGDGGANFHIQTPKDTDILWGDVFVLPELSSGVLGTVYYIDTNSQSSFKTVYLRIPGNVFQTKWVLVEKN